MNEARMVIWGRVTKPISSVPLFSEFAMAPVKYKCHPYNLRGAYARSNILVTEKLTIRALLPPPPPPPPPPPHTHTHHIPALWLWRAYPRYKISWYRNLNHTLLDITNLVSVRISIDFSDGRSYKHLILERRQTWFGLHKTMHIMGENNLQGELITYVYIYTCLFRHFWQRIEKRKNTIKYKGFVPYIHKINRMTR